MPEIKKTEQKNGSFSTFTMMELPVQPFIPKVILIAPLNWGLGHASRSAGLVRQLQQMYPEAQIILGSDGAAHKWLMTRFPGLPVLELPPYHIRYARGTGLITQMILQSPRLLYSILHEHTRLQKLIRLHSIDLVISDNRFGLWSKRCRCIFMTHQLSLAPAGKITTPLIRLATLLNRFFIGKYDECWVPDFEEEPGLAGMLSHPTRRPANTRYIGPLSRFRHWEPTQTIRQKGSLLCIVSGPEPQRSIFLTMLLEQLTAEKLEAVVVAGNQDQLPVPGLPPYIILYPDLPDEELFKQLSSCSLIISRPGYSTIMDLYHTGGCAAFVPTPGQTEQEYLARVLMQNGIAFMMEQHQFRISEMIRLSAEYSGFPGRSAP